MRTATAAFLAVLSMLGSNVARAEDILTGILFAVGDIAECPSDSNNHNRSGKAVADLIKSEIGTVEKAAAEAGRAAVPIAVLVLGDLAYDNGTPEAFEY